MNKCLTIVNKHLKNWKTTFTSIKVKRIRFTWSCCFVTEENRMRQWLLFVLGLGLGSCLIVSVRRRCGQLLTQHITARLGCLTSWHSNHFHQNFLIFQFSIVNNFDNMFLFRIHVILFYSFSSTSSSYILINAWIIY